MIEIQCTSCHTRYRIDERVLPADSPTFKCSRCGHVFTADPATLKKSSENAQKPQPSGAPAARTELKREPAPLAAPAKPEAAKPAPSKEPEPDPETQAAPTSESKAESKPAPIKPYIRNPRPTVFDRSPTPAAKPAPEPVDDEAVARMKASVEAANTEASKPNATSESPRPSQPLKNDRSDDHRENLEFDFNDDDASPELGNEPSDDNDGSESPERWSVGDDGEGTASERQSAFGRGEPDPGFSRGEPAPIGRGTIPQYDGALPPHRSPLPDERPFIERAELHSARSFIGLFFVIALVFVALTLVIYGIPSASAELLRKMPMIGAEFEQPVRLENRLNVSDVQSSYQSIKGGHHALVLTGTVTNNSDLPLHMIQIGVHLLDADQRDLASSAVFTGTTLSPRMIGEMTPHELEFLQKLDPPKNFVLQPAHAAPFLMVFIDPPREVRHFAIAISRAQPPDTAQASDTSARP